MQMKSVLDTEAKLQLPLPLENQACLPWELTLALWLVVVQFSCCIKVSSDNTASFSSKRVTLEIMSLINLSGTL